MHIVRCCPVLPLNYRICLRGRALLIVITWTKEMMRDKETSQYVDGMAFHWYFGGASRLLDGAIGWNILDRCVCVCVCVYLLNCT